jgi:hypothetical protein
VEGSKTPDPNQLSALAKLFEGLSTPAARTRFLADPSVAIGGLPKNVQELFSDLSDEELRVLVRTWNEMQAAGLVYELPTEADAGVTVSFL